MRSRRLGSALALGLALNSLTASLAPAGTVVEGTVAFVNKKPVLKSDVELTKALLKLSDKDATERSIDEALMYDDASRLLTDPPPEATIARAILSLADKAGPGFTPMAIRRKAMVQLAISSYIELRLRPQVRVEDEAVQRAFNERVVNDPQPPTFDLVADSIRESLESRELDKRVEEWIASLRVSEEIRRVTPRPKTP